MGAPAKRPDKPPINNRPHWAEIMTQAEAMSLAIALGACYAAYRFSGQATVKAAAIAVGAVIVAKRLPYIGAAL